MKKAMQLLEELVYQADEDCPVECRTRHFQDVLLEASEFVKEYKNEQ